MAEADATIAGRRRLRRDRQRGQHRCKDHDPTHRPAPRSRLI
jgi:hypothetical protein